MREGEETMERNLRYVDMGLIFSFLCSSMWNICTRMKNFRTQNLS